MTAPEEDTLKLGLLLETAHQHQALAETSLRQLESQLQGIDAAIREEVRRVLQSELLELSGESRRASDALRELRRTLRLRIVVWTLLVIGCASAIALGTLAWLLPSRGEIDALRARREALIASVSALERRGAHLDIRPCGSGATLCVRIDPRAPAYGAEGDYRVARSD